MFRASRQRAVLAVGPWVLLFGFFIPLFIAQQTRSPTVRGGVEGLDADPRALSLGERPPTRARDVRIHWREIPRRPMLRDAVANPRAAALELDYDADRLTCVWTFRRDEGPRELEAAPIRICQDVKGSEWISLEPGFWEVSLSVGALGIEPVRLPSERIRFGPRRAYRFSFGENEENRVRSNLRDRARAERRTRASGERSRR